jgi:hypothetical protein
MIWATIELRLSCLSVQPVGNAASHDGIAPPHADFSA